MTPDEVAQLVVAAVTLMTSAAAWLRTRSTGRKVDTAQNGLDHVRVLVNDRADRQEARIEQLTASLGVAGADVPPPPPRAAGTIPGPPAGP
jgi:hypothetical protein